MRHKTAFTFASLAIVLALGFILLRRPISSFASSNNSAKKQPVIVELFTSEGCSSCPPADTLLKTLSDDQPFDDIEVIALEEHVDYWNHLGWSDPFSSIDFSRRQEDYAALIPKSGVFTPQMIVDGHAQFVGNGLDEARKQILSAASHPKARLLLSPLPASKAHTRAFDLTLDPDSAPLAPTSVDFYVAVTEKGLHSKPTAGENSGEALIHSPVVRQLRKLHSVHTPLTAPLNFTVDFRDNWNPSNLTAVAFFVDHRSGQVLAAGSASIPQ